MVGASKILTVSYGTFSCTLEGFDDPFDTMKAIAEYFRDLAADDRYFGAEPPTPDAAMLHRIAEREMSRRVEARVQDNGVILRATSDAAPMPQDAAARPATVAPASVFEPDEPVTLPTLSESVAVKLQRLRAAAYAAAGPVVDAELAPAREPAPEPLAPQVMPSAFEARTDDADETEPHQTAAEAVAEDAAPTEPDAEPETSAPAPRAEDIAAAPQDEASETAPAADEETAAPAEIAEEHVGEAPAYPDFPEDFADADAAAFDAPDVAGIDEGMEVTPEAIQAEAPDSSETEAPALSHDSGRDDDMTALIAGLARDAAPQPPLDAVADVLPEAAPVAEADDLPEALDEAVDAPDAVLTLADEPELPEDAPPAFAPEASTIDLPQAAPDADEPFELRAVAEKSPDNTPPMFDASDIFVDDEPLEFTLDSPQTVEPEAQPEAATPVTEDAEALAAAAIAEIEGTDLPALDAAEAEAAEGAPAEEEPEVLIEVAHATMIEVELELDAEPEPAPLAAAEYEADDRFAPEPRLETVPEASTPEAPAAGPDDAETAEPTSDVVAKIQRARARVIKIRRIEPVADEAAEPEPSSADPAAEAPGSTTDEAEAALDRSLIALRGEPAVVQPQRPVRVTNERDADVQRLIAQTNTEMEGPENRRRLSAIAHLKAAVAATFADRKAGVADAGESEDSRITPYRGDLERVVRPRRPVSASGGTEADKPAEAPARPAPLMLLSEYRVDRPKPAESAAPSAQVWPRRVAASNLALSDDADDDYDDDADLDLDAEEENIFGSASGFARFAEKLGASNLPDLLEAAAVYAAQVEGRPHLSRPQLLRQVQDALPEAAGSREDQLRAFGTLLRAGRIEKVKRGQFAVTGTSHYLAEAQKIAR